MARALVFVSAALLLLSVALSSSGVGSTTTTSTTEAHPLSADKHGLGLGLIVFGLRSGRGTCGCWRRSPLRFPIFITAVTTLARLFHGRKCGACEPKFGAKLTVMDALSNESNDGFSAIARHGVASLLNSYTVQDFPFTPDQVGELFDAALDTEESAALQAQHFEQANALV